MQTVSLLIASLALLAPALLCAYAIYLSLSSYSPLQVPQAWRRFSQIAVLATLASVGALVSVWVILPGSVSEPVWIVENWIGLTRFSVIFALLVQCLGLVIGAFSTRYLQGEPRQIHYIIWLSTVLGCVQLLVLAQHWLVLIFAWTAVGLAMQRLLCFYQDRPFALLAARKKHLADRVADVLLVLAAVLAWYEIGQGSFIAIQRHLAENPAGLALQASAVLLVLAVVIRTALLPAHGWLTQVMEAPTPVSALLHAGVVNLGGFVLIQMSPLLDSVAAARWILIIMGLTTALLAALVILTRISIKVRLAWSTIAQMGFMVLECGLGLYTLAALHLVGHSLYKAHAFLRSSSIVQDVRARRLNAAGHYKLPSLIMAPVLALLVTVSLISMTSPADHSQALPVWWGVLLAMAWAPLFWLPTSAHIPNSQRKSHLRRLLSATALVTLLCLIIRLGHALPIGLTDTPNALGGWASAIAMGAFYLVLVCMHVCPDRLETLRRWSYAGFYVDEFYTRLTLSLWSGQWVPADKNNRVLRNRWLDSHDTPTSP